MVWQRQNPDSNAGKDTGTEEETYSFPRPEKIALNLRL